MELWELKKENLLLYKKPFTTLYYFIRESLHLIYQSYFTLRTYRRTAVIIISFILIYLSALQFNGFHTPFLLKFQSKILWCLYWIGLGILSSVGLGTGLHTFILYLGPHIASVTLAAYECESLSFPEPPYPDEIICPEDDSLRSIITFWDIMSKVRLEAFMWGAGTALGELPPYFMAKAARLSGSKESNGVQDTKRTNSRWDGVADFALSTRSFIQVLIKKVGFFGILACASVPNPLFDLAGITCGHFLVPFWTFFGATLIGKAVIKMHIQKLFVILAFNDKYMEYMMNNIVLLPGGKKMHGPLRELIEKQKKSLHRAGNNNKETSMLSAVFEKFMMVMILYFILSIIHSMAKNNWERTQKVSINIKKDRKKKD